MQLMVQTESIEKQKCHQFMLRGLDLITVALLDY